MYDTCVLCKVTHVRLCTREFPPVKWADNIIIFAIPNETLDESNLLTVAADFSPGFRRLCPFSPATFV